MVARVFTRVPSPDSSPPGAKRKHVVFTQGVSRPSLERVEDVSSRPAGDRRAARRRLREPARFRLQAGHAARRPPARLLPRGRRSADVCERVAVVCKRDTQLPDLPGTERWDEPDEPRHPLTGIVHALATAGGPVLVCAADMPFVTADACRTLVQAAATGPAVVATAGGVLQPTSACTRLPRWRRCAPRRRRAADPHGRGARPGPGGAARGARAQRQHPGRACRGGGAARLTALRRDGDRHHVARRVQRTRVLLAPGQRPGGQPGVGAEAVAGLQHPLANARAVGEREAVVAGAARRADRTALQVVSSSGPARSSRCDARAHVARDRGPRAGSRPCVRPPGSSTRPPFACAARVSAGRVERRGR